MNGALLDLPATLNRLLEYAHNFSIEKAFILLHLDPNNITFDAVFHRMVDVITIANVCALAGAIFYAATFLMPTMVPLRIFGILSAVFFLAYGILGSALGTFLMYLLLLPINSLRLFQILKLIKKARTAAQGDLSMDWLKPFMNTRNYRKGDILFRKGQLAHEMYLTVTGKFLVTEINIELPPGQLVGEIGFLMPNNRRTQTVKCIENGSVMTISYDRLLEVYFDQPDFGYYFLRLSSNRLIQNNARLEATIEEYKLKLQNATATKAP